MSTARDAAADLVASLMRAGLLPVTGDGMARVEAATGLSAHALASARQRLGSGPWSATDAVPMVRGRSRFICLPPAADESEWLAGTRIAPLFSCDHCGRPFWVRRHYEGHLLDRSMAQEETAA